MRKINVQKKEAFTAKVLRLLRANRSFSELSSDEEIIPAIIPVGDQGKCRKEIRAAWLDMERKKAEALVESQRRRVIY